LFCQTEAAEANILATKFTALNNLLHMPLFNAKAHYVGTKKIIKKAYETVHP
jgi:hypothetical protein